MDFSIIVRNITFVGRKFMRKSQVIFCIGLILALAISGCASNSTTNSVAAVGVVSNVTIVDKVDTTGNLDAGQLVQLTWGVSGLVDKVNVKVGQKVKAGDILASLQAASVPANLASAQSDLASAKRNLEDLKNSKLSQAQAQQAYLAAKKAVEVAQNNMDALDYPRASDALIKNTEAQIVATQKQLVIDTGKYKDLQHHPDGDPFKIAAQLAMTNDQLKLNDLIATLNYYNAKATEADYAEAKANLDVARANLAAADRTRNNVKSGPDPLTIDAAQAKVIAAQAIVNTMFAIAPFDGEVIAVQAVSGNAVDVSQASIALVDRNTLKVDTQIDETVISTVLIGNSADISMDSLPGTVLKGKVSQINPIGTVVNGLVKYAVTVSIDPTDKPLLFGATASVVIYTGEPHSSLAVPVSAVSSDTRGEYVLLVNADGSTQRINVVSGDLVDILVTITTTDKLAVGDQVELGATNTSSSSSSGTRNQGGGGFFPGGPGGG
jgi:multidrug resistance efflux pump